MSFSLSPLGSYRLVAGTCRPSTACSGCRVTLAVTSMPPMSTIGQIGNATSLARGAAAIGRHVDVARGLPCGPLASTSLSKIAPPDRLLRAAAEHRDHQQQQHAQAEHVPDEVTALLRRLFVGRFIVRDCGVWSFSMNMTAFGRCSANGEPNSDRSWHVGERPNDGSEARRPVHPMFRGEKTTNIAAADSQQRAGSACCDCQASLEWPVRRDLCGLPVHD